jgi:hypothetical protein
MVRRLQKRAVCRIRSLDSVRISSRKDWHAG